MTTPFPNGNVHRGTPETLGFLWTGHGSGHSLYGGNHEVGAVFPNADTLGQGNGKIELLFLKLDSQRGGICTRSCGPDDLKMSLFMAGIG